MHPGHLALDTRAGWTQTERGAMTKGMERQRPKLGNFHMRLVHSRSKSITHEKILGSSEHTLWGHHTLAESPTSMHSSSRTGNCWAWKEEGFSATELSGVSRLKLVASCILKRVTAPSKANWMIKCYARCSGFAESRFHRRNNRSTVLSDT